VQHPQNPHDVSCDAINSDVGRAANDQLPRSLDAAGATALRKPYQDFNLFPDSFIHGDGGVRAVGFDVIEIALRSACAKMDHSSRERCA